MHSSLPPSGDLTPYFHAIELAYNRLFDTDVTPHPFPPGVRPLVVVMSAEAGLTDRLRALDDAGAYEFILSPANADFTPDEQAEYDRILGAARGSWSQALLRRASPALRKALTRQLVAELTVYSRYADAFVVSGNSNLGRLALALAGEEGAMGMPGKHRFGGRVRSIDVPFFPTMRLESIYPDPDS